MKEKKTAAMIERHWVMRLRVAVKKPLRHVSWIGGRLFLKKLTRKKYRSTFLSTIFPARLMSFSRCFSNKIAIFKNVRFFRQFSHTEKLRTHSLSSPPRPEMSFFGSPHRIHGFKNNSASLRNTISVQHVFHILHTGVDYLSLTSTNYPHWYFSQIS